MITEKSLQYIFYSLGYTPQGIYSENTVFLEVLEIVPLCVVMPATQCRVRLTFFILLPIFRN